MVTPGILRSDIVIPYLKYLATFHIHPVTEVYRNPGISNAFQYPPTDHIITLSQRLKMSIEFTASSMLQNTMMSGNNPSLGTLVILPREIRDEIYRHLFKGHYFLYDGSGRMRSRTQTPDLALFSVSKATYDEGSSMLYSESVFQFAFDRPIISTACLPERTLRRMKKIEVVFNCYGNWHAWYSDTLNKFKIGRTLCDSLTVTFQLYSPNSPNSGEILLGHLSQKLGAFKSFRTVTLKVNRDKYPSTGSNGGEDSKYITRVIKQE